MKEQFNNYSGPESLTIAPRGRINKVKKHRCWFVTRGWVLFLLLAVIVSMPSCGKHNSNSNPSNITWQTVPWADGDQTNYVVQDTSNNTIGYVNFTINKEDNAWVFRQDYDLTVNQKEVTQQITIRARGQDLKPISGSITGSAQSDELYTEYGDRELLITIKSPDGEEQNQTFDIGSIHDAYDNNEAIFLVRSLALQVGFRSSYTNIIPLSVVSTTTASWTVDTTGPIATLSGQPTGMVNYNTTDITVGGPNVVAYKYKLDNSTAAWGNETMIATHITLSGLSIGQHIVYVIGKDAAGTWQTIATTAGWTVCSTGPIATLSGQPAGTVNYRTANITVGGTDVVAYKYKLDDGNYTANETPVDTKIALSGLSSGLHTVYVIGKNAAGTWQVVATMAVWSVYTTGPLATLSGPPTGVVNYNTADITVDGPNVVAYKYRVDGGSWSEELATSTHITLSGLSDGEHTVSVKGKDAAGNWQAGQLAMSMYELKVTDLEYLSTPEGDFWAYKMSLLDSITGQGVYLWYSEDAPHFLLKYDDGRKVYWLVEHN